MTYVLVRMQHEKNTLLAAGNGCIPARYPSDDNDGFLYLEGVFR